MPTRGEGDRPMVITSDTHWTIDKKIPVAVIIALAGNLLALVIGATLTYAQIADHERRLMQMEAARHIADGKAQEFSSAIVRLQETTAMMREAVTELRQAARTR